MKKYFYLAAIAVAFVACDKSEQAKISNEAGNQSFDYTSHSLDEILEISGSKYANLIKNSALLVEDDKPHIEFLDGVFQECVDGPYCVPFESTCMMIVTVVKETVGQGVYNYYDAEVTEYRSNGPKSVIHPLVTVDHSSSSPGIQVTYN